jgi:hypothetical protein
VWRRGQERGGGYRDTHHHRQAVPDEERHDCKVVVMSFKTVVPRDVRLASGNNLIASSPPRRRRELAGYVIGPPIAIFFQAPSNVNVAIDLLRIDAKMRRRVASQRGAVTHQR